MKRYTVALITLVVTFIASFFFAAKGASDFTWALYASELMFKTGVNPYPLFPVTTNYPLNDHLYYPIFAIMVANLFRMVDYSLAGNLFISISSAIIAHNTYERKHRVTDVILTFANISYLSAFYYCQWSIFLLAFPILWFVKPTVGIIAFMNIRRTSIKITSFVILLVATIVSIVFWPWWFDSWLYVISNFKNKIYLIPAVVFPPLMLTFIPLLFRVRGWPLILSAVVPQSVFFYDQFIYWGLVNRTWEKVILFVFGWIGILAFALYDVDLYIAVLPDL